MFEDDPRIDAALDALPVYPAPPGLKRRVMEGVSRLQAERMDAPAPAGSFRLDFLDFALPMFFALFGMLSLAGLLVVMSLLDPLRQARLQLALQTLAWRLPELPQGMLGLFVAAGLLGMLLALLVAFLWLAPVRLVIRQVRGI